MVTDSDFQKWSHKKNSQITPVDKNDMDFIPIAAAQGLDSDKKSCCGMIKRATVGKLTAQGINDFQKTLFPFMFLTFVVLFAFCTYYRVGDVEPKDLDD